MNITNLIYSIKQELLQQYAAEQALSLAWVIVEHITKRNRTYYILNDTMNIDTKDEQKITALVKEHLDFHKPLQYLLGSIDFLDLTLVVKAPILIPRPETEELCLNLIKKLSPITKTPKKYNLSILDLCTGSGCIALSCAQAYKNAHIYGIDNNPQAIKLAEYNAAINSILNITFIESDLYEKLPDILEFDIIIANPPYISEQEWHTLEPQVKNWEDIQALVAADDGFAIIKNIAQDAHKWLKKRILSELTDIPQLVLEIGYQQAEQTVLILETAGFNTIVIHKDFAHNNRVIYASFI